MSAVHSIRNFRRVLEDYGEDQPLARFLKEFFRKNKQMGSSDRRTVGHLLYTYFRLGKAASALDVERRLAIALYLCAPADGLLETLDERLFANRELALPERMAFLAAQPAYTWNAADVFPFASHFSAGLDADAFVASQFAQPDLFTRAHRGKQELVSSKLSGAGIQFTVEDNGAIRLPNATKLGDVLPEQVYEVQDLSSQQTGRWFRPQKWDKWWDACAASGGKSLLLCAQEPDVSLVVSDLRESVLANLDERFRNAGIRKYQKKVLDLTDDPEILLHDYAFDGIILDAPCSGSGTWGRSPEMISQFRESSIRNFQALQRSIVKNVIPYLKPGKPLIYITCSVFKEENEEMTAWLTSEYGFTPEGQELLKGYEVKADTMFVARLIKGD